MTGIEPAWPAWKAGALPLSYIREHASCLHAPEQPSGSREPLIRAQHASTADVSRQVLAGQGRAVVHQGGRGALEHDPAAVVTGAGAGLTPDYAPLGKVTEGMDVVQAIGELGDPASGGAGVPLQSVVIEKATVREH